MTLGDYVVYRRNPLLYGVMRVGALTADGWAACQQCHPSISPARRRTELFLSAELVPFTDELVDVQAAAAALPPRDEGKGAE